ncbi:MAG: diacylglycerol kinase family protein [Desulfobacterales bacterium]
MISNPRSGSNRRRLPAIRRLFPACDCIRYREAVTPEAVLSVLDSFARDGVNLVAINAGDGTVQAALTALFHHKPYRTLPALALIRGGTTNMTHLDLGCKGRQSDALGRLIRWVRVGVGNPTIARRPVMRVRHPLQLTPQFGMFLGAAAIHRGIELFHSRVHGMGLTGDPAHLLILFRFLAALVSRDATALGSAPARIHVDDRPLPPRHFLLIAAYSLDRLIMGLRPRWKGLDGPIHLTAISADPRHFIPALPSLLWGRPTRRAVEKNGFFSQSGQSIRLSLTGGYAVDGERFFADSRDGDLLIDVGGYADFIRI